MPPSHKLCSPFLRISKVERRDIGNDFALVISTFCCSTTIRKGSDVRIETVQGCCCAWSAFQRPNIAPVHRRPSPRTFATCTPRPLAAVPVVCATPIQVIRYCTLFQFSSVWGRVQLLASREAHRGMTAGGEKKSPACPFHIPRVLRL